MIVIIKLYNLIVTSNSTVSHHSDNIFLLDLHSYLMSFTHFFLSLLGREGKKEAVEHRLNGIKVL